MLQCNMISFTLLCEVPSKQRQINTFRLTYIHWLPLPVDIGVASSG